MPPLHHLTLTLDNHLSAFKVDNWDVKKGDKVDAAKLSSYSSYCSKGPRCLHPLPSPLLSHRQRGINS